ncbi:hypothetical protein EOA29_25915 [Mesorhizobium sp. M1E.F.Ca.ET.063.01.1.1]|nr:hypothetical protein EOA29_25915 [Mesorhizobium sp. M1E.F.Ca.ET.063.01.1.1]
MSANSMAAPPEALQANALAFCLYRGAIPDGKPLRTFPGIALADTDHLLMAERGVVWERAEGKGRNPGARRLDLDVDRV